MTNFSPEAFTQSLSMSNKMLVDTLVNVANTALAAAEQIVALNTQTVRTMAEEGASATKAMLDAKTPQEVAAIQAGMAQPGMEKAVAYSRSLYEIAAQAQQALAQQVSNVTPRK